MTDETMCDRFLALHLPGAPLLMPNPWDIGSARLLAALGFAALATTSGGFATTLGRRDGQVSRDEALGDAGDLAAAVDVPVSADLERCFADEPEGVAETVALALGAGVAGCSVEDATGRTDQPLYEFGLARVRVEAAAEAAHRGPARLVLTARCENLIRGRVDIDDTVARLQAYGEAGADVLFAPGLRDPGDIRRVVTSVDRPVSVLAAPGLPTVAELAELGVARISVGSGFAWAALGALVDAAAELRGPGTYGFAELGGRGREAAVSAFSG